MDLQEKIAARKRERETEKREEAQKVAVREREQKHEKRLAEMRAWGVHGVAINQNSTDEGAASPDGTSLPTDESAIDAAIYKAKLKGADSFSRSLHYIYLVLSVASIAYAAALFIDRAHLAAFFVAIFAWVLWWSGRDVINKVTPPNERPPESGNHGSDRS